MPDRGADEAGDRQPPHWWIYRGTGEVLDPAERDQRWPAPPRWRAFSGGPDLPAPPEADANIERRLGTVRLTEQVDRHVVDMVNAALYLRRPLLVTGRPGSGKSTLAYQIARELSLGRVLHWPITTRTTLNSGLYAYDAIGRVQAASERRARLGDGPVLPAAGVEADPATEPAVGGSSPPDESQVGNYLHLGPLGTALLPYRLPRVLLVDELDKSDVDLPNDLLNVLEDGEYPIPELIRVRQHHATAQVHTADPKVTATVHDGHVRCHEFPIVVITSNDEREFPAAFLRRCLQLRLPDPDEHQLAGMVAAHFPSNGHDDLDRAAIRELITAYLQRRSRVDGLAADQLLNAVALRACGAAQDQAGWDRLLEAIWHRLSAAGQG